MGEDAVKAIIAFYNNKDEILGKNSIDELTLDELRIIDDCLKATKELLVSGEFNSETVKLFKIDRLSSKNKKYFKR